jgi:general secretion pathway protein L
MIVRLGEQPDSAEWLRLESGQVVARGDGLPAAGSAAPWVLVPGSSVSQLLAQLPARAGRSLAQLLPYALEDRVVGEVDQLHFAPGERQADGRLAVTVVARQRMDGWLQSLQAAGLQPAVMVPETALLPQQAEHWQLWLSADGAWLGAPGELALAGDRANAALLLDAALRDCPVEQRPQRLTVTLFDDRRPGDDALEQLAEHGVAVQWERAEDDLAALLAQRLVTATRAPVDLLVGPYGRREAIGRLWRPWRAAAALLLGWALLQFVGLGLELRAIDAEREGLAQRMAALYREVMPGSEPLDPRRQLASALASRQRAGGTDQGDLGEALALAGPVLAGEEGVQIQSLRFRPGQLELELRLASLQLLDRLRDRLSAGSGWAVEIRSANALQDRVETRLVLRREGA